MGTEGESAEVRITPAALGRLRCRSEPADDLDADLPDGIGWMHSLRTWEHPPPTRRARSAPTPPAAADSHPPHAPEGPRKRFAKDTVLIVDGTLVPTRDHTIAEPSKNHRYSTNHQVVIDADTRLVVVVGRPLAGNRNDCKAREESGAKAAVGNTVTIADGGYLGTGLVMPHRRKRGQSELPDWKQEHNKSHKQVRARVEHVFARMKTWKILRDCRLKGDGVHHAMLGIARMHNVALAGWARGPRSGQS